MFLCPWDFPDKNTGVGCHALLQGIFPTQGSNLHLLCLLHCWWILYLRTYWEALSLQVYCLSKSAYHSSALGKPKPRQGLPLDSKYNLVLGMAAVGLIHALHSGWTLVAPPSKLRKLSKGLLHPPQSCPPKYQRPASTEEAIDVKSTSIQGLSMGLFPKLLEQCGPVILV